MKYLRHFVFLLALLPMLASAQTYPYYPPPGQAWQTSPSYQLTLGVLGAAATLTASAPSGATGAGGGFTVAGGAGGATSGNGGALNILGGAANNGSAGPVNVSGGAATTGTGGSINLKPGTGTALANAGVINLQDAAGNNTLIIDQFGNVACTCVSTAAAIDGFSYLGNVTAAPTGVPAHTTGTYANSTPMRYDTADNRLYAYNGAWVNVANQDSGTWTATIATGCTTTPNATFAYSRSGNIVTLTNGAAGALTCTSNTTGMTITGLPSALFPAHEHEVAVQDIEDGSTNQLSGAALVSPSGVITFLLARTNITTNDVVTSSAAFTNTGTKGIAHDALSITYSLD